MSLLISSFRHAVMRGPNFTGAGNRPALTPAHQVERDTGMGPSGLMMDLNRLKPLEASVVDVMTFSISPRGGVSAWRVMSLTAAGGEGG
jgi:hypothetical protein